MQTSATEADAVLTPWEDVATKAIVGFIYGLMALCSVEHRVGRWFAALLIGFAAAMVL